MSKFVQRLKQKHRRLAMPPVIAARAIVAGTAAFALMTGPATAQDFSAPSGGWETGIEAPADTPSTTIIKQAPDKDAQRAQQLPPGMTSVRLVALLTAEGQRIEKGLVWRVFRFDKETGQSQLVQTYREASPSINFRPGSYVINVAFGRANLTRELNFDGTDRNVVENFVLNAGALRVKAQHNENDIDRNAIRYSIFSDRTQLDERQLILANVRPGLIVRLNAGIYHIVSRFGDANATVDSDVTVEAGKLTEATINHSAARVRFKLVTREGGEALPDTQWRVETPQGEVVKKSVGALPMHILAPGTYTVVGISGGQSFQREFTVTDGEMLDVEVVRR